MTLIKIHPIKAYRHQLGLTQFEFAKKLPASDLTSLILTNNNEGYLSEQYARRLEMGMVNPPIRGTGTNFLPLARTLVTLLSEKFEAETYAKVKLVDLILDGYKVNLGLKARLASYEARDASIADRIQAQIYDWYYLKRYEVKDNLSDQNLLGFNYKNTKHLMETICRYNGVPGTVYAFCRLLGLHPFTVQQWIRRDSRTETWPSEIIRVLTFIGIPWERLHFK